MADVQKIERAVLYGGIVAEQGTPDMSVQVSAAGLKFDNAPVQVSADATVTISAAPDGEAAAALTTALAGADNDLTFTAVTAGDAGNSTTVEYVWPGAPDQVLSVLTVDQAITVNLATDSSVAVTTTADDIASLVNADLDASALVSAANAPANSGAGVVTDMAAAPLTGGVSDTARWDLILVDDAGTITVAEGDPAVPDVLGLVPVTSADATKLELGRVYVASGQTTVTTDDISGEARPLIPDDMSQYPISNLWFGPPSLGRSDVTWADNELYIVPWFTSKTFAVQTIGVRLQGGSAATAGTKVRLGIYRDDGTGALSLLTDTGQLAADGGTGDVTASISETLEPGWWWFACAFQSVGATKPTIVVASLRGLSPIGAPTLATQALQTSGTYGGIMFPSVSGALPDPPTSPDYTKTEFPVVWVQAV